MREHRDDKGNERRIEPRQVAGLVLLALVVVFVVENTGKTKIRFIVPEVEAPLWVALFVAMVAGALIGWLAGRSRRD